MLGLGGFGGLLWIKLAPQPDARSFTGSSACERCHEEITRSWQASQHTKMMRPADAPGVVVADFSDEAARSRIDLDEVVWAIGGKWEQQFMGEDDQGETLEPGAWMHLSREWQFKGWDGWQVPVPKRRCHGCHTVGLDVETGSFVEPNIGCESCHGAASWHVRTWGLGRVTSTASADACGQCHSRGKDPSGRYFFPVGYTPGSRLDEHFEALLPSPGQTSSQWWGNGHARDRHQELAAWRQGGHSKSLESLRDGYDGRFGPAADDCLSCHAAEAVLQPWLDVSLETAREPITCAVCHNVHGRLDEPRMACGECHGGAESAFHHTPDLNPGHVPCPESAQVECADCHMPQTAKIGGEYALHSHSAGIVTPRQAETWGMPSSCQNGGCHVGDPLERFDAFFEGGRRAMALEEKDTVQ
ncbi:MAG: multiheme c-type cytochrome [Myxococcota bacterium]